MPQFSDIQFRRNQICDQNMLNSDAISNEAIDAPGIKASAIDNAFGWKMTS